MNNKPPKGTRQQKNVFQGFSKKLLHNNKISLILQRFVKTELKYLKH